MFIARQQTAFSLAACVVVAAIVMACTAEPTGIAAVRIGDVALAKPSACPGQVNLSITLGDAAGDGILSDGGGAYVGGVDGVGAHSSGVNGNLMLSVRQSATRRIAYSTTAGSGQSDNRLYTNSHTNPGGDNACGLVGMSVGSSGSAVVSFELSQGNRMDIIHYGKLCNGSADAGTRVTTTRADADNWTITGASGRHCRAGSNGKYTQIGTAGAFSMALVRQ